MNQLKPERMHCMEVWGGNHATERSVETPGLKIWVYSRPFEQATGGGDVHYVSSCASGRITRMLLADVSGHGEVVSHTAIALRDLLRQNVNYISQTRFVKAMNQQFAELSEQGGFATAVASTFFSPTQSLAVCNAGHPPPLVFRDTTSEWSELKHEQCQSSVLADIPLGISKDVSYRQFDTQLRTGDMMLSYSDAVPESLDRDGRQLGQEGMLRLVQELGHKDPNKVIPALIERISTSADGNLEQDDATLVLCCATGGNPSLRDNLLAPFRLLGSVADRTELS